MIDRLRVWSLVALIVFLPLSAWLVSLSGSILVSLIRDGLLGLLIVLSLPNWRHFRRPDTTVWLGLAFVLLVLVSYFGRQDSALQWLRGVRYLIEPVLLLMVLMVDPLPDNGQLPISRALMTSLILVLIGGVIDYFWPALLRLSLNSGGVGYLGQIHYAATSVRLQSTLAGPNALGLFLMVCLLLNPFWSRSWLGRLSIGLVVSTAVALVLTFSRSSWVGMMAGVISYLYLARHSVQNAGRYLAIIIALIGLLVLGVVAFRPAALTRFNSNAVRLEQYQRIWRERGQIGWFGRGAGTAGLVSEYSFDASPNYFSENSYLDVYENIGLVGALAYLAMWIWLIILFSRQPTLIGRSVCAAVVGLAIAGIFIDHYTGQAAIWLVLMMAGLTLTKNPAETAVPAGRIGGN